MRWQVAGGMGVPLAAAIFCMLPLFTSSNGDIREWYYSYCACILYYVTVAQWENYCFWSAGQRPTQTGERRKRASKRILCPTAYSDQNHLLWHREHPQAYCEIRQHANCRSAPPVCCFLSAFRQTPVHTGGFHRIPVDFFAYQSIPAAISSNVLLIP